MEDVVITKCHGGSLSPGTCIKLNKPTIGVYLSEEEIKVNANRNSFQTSVKMYIETTRIPDDVIGNNIFIKVPNLLQPSTAAASKTS